MKTFIIDGLNELLSVKIGNNSFTSKKENKWEHFNNDFTSVGDESKSFHVLNCQKLQSIEIDYVSFSDFEGDFELKNLPSLQSIIIGSLTQKSFNFCKSSFVVTSIFEPTLS